MCVCICCNSVKCDNGNYDKLPAPVIDSLITSSTFPGGPVEVGKGEDHATTLSKAITPALKQLFKKSFGYEYAGADTKPTDSPGSVSNLSNIEVLTNFSEIPIDNYDNVRKCMTKQFTAIDTLESKVLTNIVDDTVKSASAIFGDFPLYEWKPHVFTSSVSVPTDSKATQETRGVVYFAHIDDEGEKACILYYILVNWQSNA